MARPFDTPSAMGTPVGTGSSGPVPPRTPAEEAVRAIWQEVLGRSDIGVTDDFFDLDASSVLAIQVVARIRETWNVDIRARDFFENPTVAALAHLISAGPTVGAGVPGAPVPAAPGPRPPDAAPDLSFDQQRLWLENQLRPGSAYNVHGRRRLVGPLDVKALEASVRTILARHDILRTRFPTQDGSPFQLVEALDENWSLQVTDLSALTQGRDEAALRLADEQASAPFDLSAGRLFRCLLIRLSTTEHVLSITAHHIVCDDWSIGLFVRELSVLYRAAGDLARTDLPDLPIQYLDYAVWQRRWLAGRTIEAQVEHWREHLAGAPVALALPTARRRHGPGGSTTDRIRAALSEQDSTALQDLCRSQGVTPFMALTACLTTVLGRWSGQSDVVVGVPITGRSDVATEQIIGFFVNTLPLRVQMSGDPAFADLLGVVRRSALSGYTHADAPLDMLVQRLQVPRDPYRTPLFQIILNVVDEPADDTLDGVTVHALEVPPQTGKFDLTLTAQRFAGTLRLELEFDRSHFDADTLRLLVGQVLAVLRAASEDPARRLSRFALDSSGGLRATEPPVSGTTGPDPVRSAAQWFAGIEDRIALTAPDGRWTYRRLGEAADRVAAALARHEAPAGAPLGVVRRDAGSFVAAVLGCVLAETSVCVVEPGAVDACPGLSFRVDVTSDGEASVEALAATPATGSRGAARTVLPGTWADAGIVVTETDRFAVLSTRPGALVAALGTAVRSGAALVLPPLPATGEAERLVDWLRSEAVTVVQASAPLLRAMAARAGGQLPDLRYIVVDNDGGLLSHDVAMLRTLAPAAKVVAVYRTDRHGRAAAVFMAPDDWDPRTAPVRVPVGTPLPGADVRLQDPSGNPAAVGELVAILVDGEATGDLGRRLVDGRIEFAAAAGETPGGDVVETVAVLRDIPEIVDAVVVRRPGEDGGDVLVAYVAAPAVAAMQASGGRDGEALRRRLVSRLPEHLVPRQIVVLAPLPLTMDGDHDVAGLPEPPALAEDTYVAPRTPMEHQLADILGELLEVARVGIHDSFFELGGFSLLATRLISRIRELYFVEISLREIFEAPTVDGLAQLIVRSQGELSGDEDLAALLDEIASSGT